MVEDGDTVSVINAGADPVTLWSDVSETNKHFRPWLVAESEDARRLTTACTA